MWIADSRNGSNGPSLLDQDYADQQDEDPPGRALAVVQLILLVPISLLGTLANGVVFAVFYRRPSLRTISNRFVLSLILANLTSSAISVPGHIYQLVNVAFSPRVQPSPSTTLSVAEETTAELLIHFTASNLDVSASSTMTTTTADAAATAAAESSTWCWHQQGLDGLTVLVSLASVLSILLISLDRYYAVNSPLHYSIIVTRQKSTGMIGLVWLISAVLSAPVWSGSVLLHDPVMAIHADLTVVIDNRTSSLSVGETIEESRQEDQARQQYLMNLCYGVSLIFFGFVWPLCALCWLYLRMYEAALKNSARTRRQSLCSNPTATAGSVTQQQSHSTQQRLSVSGMQQTAGELGVPIDRTPDISCTVSHQPSLGDILVTNDNNSHQRQEHHDQQTSARLLAVAAAAASSSPSPSPRPHQQGNREWASMTGIQRHIWTFLWREEGRALRTTAMVISSFTACWLPFFVWMLPFQLYSVTESPPNNGASASLSAGLFLARLAAFSNVLVSPGIYVYRNQVAQREAGRVLVTLFCPCGRSRRQSQPLSRYCHDEVIAVPIVMSAGAAGLTGVAGYGSRRPSSQPHHQSDRLRADSAGCDLELSRRSSSLVTSSTESPSTRKGSHCPSEPTTEFHQPNHQVAVSWRGRSSSIDCRVLSNCRIETATQSEEDVNGEEESDAMASPQPSSQTSRFCVSKLDADQCHSRSPKTFRKTRQRSQTISGEMVAQLTDASLADTIRPLLSRAEVTRSPASHRHNRRHSQHPPASVVRKFSAVYTPQLAYPSSDFFDTGLEDYGHRSSSSSFSRYIQQQETATSPAAGSRQSSRRSFKAMLSRNANRDHHQGGGGKQQQSLTRRWPSVFNRQSHNSGSSPTGSVLSSMPANPPANIPCARVTAV